LSLFLSDEQKQILANQLNILGAQIDTAADLATWNLTASNKYNDKSILSNPFIPLNNIGKPLVFPSFLIDPVSGKAFGAANPLPIISPTNAKYDQTSGTATGYTATTATFNIVNSLVVSGVALVTSGASTITVKGTTSGTVLAVVTLPTLAVALTPASWSFTPTVALQGETVTLTIGANFTSGTVTINVYGN
jgi:hypothetical protein